MLAKQKRLADHFNLLSFDDAQKGRELEPKKKNKTSPTSQHVEFVCSYAIHKIYTPKMGKEL